MADTFHIPTPQIAAAYYDELWGLFVSEWGKLDPFITHRKSMGYLVTVRTLEDILFTTCNGIRLAIGLWYLDGDPSYDHYCLLVSDHHTKRFQVAGACRLDVETSLGGFGQDPVHRNLVAATV